MSSPSIIAIVPAAGIGTRMKAQIPKQYLILNGRTILEHTLLRLLQHDDIEQVVVALHKNDVWFEESTLATHEAISVVYGGDTRADSVINALQRCPTDSWALVHDAARPCVQADDISTLIAKCTILNSGGAILATPVRDTMKRSSPDATSEVQHTVDRENLWHALTPQMFRCGELLDAYIQAQQNQHPLTDEASAIEYMGGQVQLVASHPGNIKITHPDDLELARFYLQQENDTCE